MEITVFGLGYVGCVTAACLAGLGHSVTGVDPDHHKVDGISRGRSPFFEPGLEELIRDAVTAGRLSAVSSAGEAPGGAGVAMICVGTPARPDGDIDLGQLRRVVADIASRPAGEGEQLIVAVRSTVFPGTCEEIVEPALAARSEVSVVSNPEFMREGSAVRDFMEPSLVVVGGADSEAVRRFAAIYEPLGIEPCLVSLRVAETIKYACNAFHAIKIAFANEVGTLCERLDIPGREVMELLCRDVKLNASPAYLRPGLPFGGSCLPKDLRALAHRASRLSLELPLLESTLPSNRRHLDRIVQSVLDRPGRLGVIGLAFKENTDDVRESPAAALLGSLIAQGRVVRVYDPSVRLGSIYGANYGFILKAIPRIESLWESDLARLLDWAQELVLTQLPGAEARGLIEASGLPVLDLTGQWPRGDSPRGD